MRLFETGKVGLFLDDFGPSTEKRTSGEVEVIVLTLRVQPFTSQLAASMDPKVRAALFMLNGNAEPKKEINSAVFNLPFSRQVMTCFASSDTVKPSIAFDQVKVKGVMARTEKGVDGYACVLKVAFGPAGKNELEYINGWYKTQRSVTFEEAEPDLDYEEPQPERKAKSASLPGIDDAADGDATEGESGDAPELVGATAASGSPAPDRANRRMHSHAGDTPRNRKGMRGAFASGRKNS